MVPTRISAEGSTCEYTVNRTLPAAHPSQASSGSEVFVRTKGPLPEHRWATTTVDANKSAKTLKTSPGRMGQTLAPAKSSQMFPAWFRYLQKSSPLFEISLALSTHHFRVEPKSDPCGKCHSAQSTIPPAHDSTASAKRCDGVRNMSLGPRGPSSAWPCGGSPDALPASRTQPLGGAEGRGRLFLGPASAPPERLPPADPSPGAVPSGG